MRYLTIGIDVSIEIVWWTNTGMSPSNGNPMFENHQAVEWPWWNHSCPKTSHVSSRVPAERGRRGWARADLGSTLRRTAGRRPALAITSAFPGIVDWLAPCQLTVVSVAKLRGSQRSPRALSLSLSFALSGRLFTTWPAAAEAKRSRLQRSSTSQPAHRHTKKRCSVEILYGIAATRWVIWIIFSN